MAATTDVDKAFRANLQAALKQGKDGGRQALAVIGIEGLNRVRSLLSTPGSGRTYVRRGKVHVASAPGQPPAVDTGRLRSSYLYAVGSEGGQDFVAIGTSVEYAPHLEFGTSRPMAPRPHLRPAALALQGIIGKVISDGWGNNQGKGL